MKLLTWNCAGAFRKKTGQLASFNPDLAVIQECERPEKLIFPQDFQPASMAWFGDAGAAKGVGIFAFAGLQVEVADEIYDPTIRYCVPLRVTGAWNFHLIAIWAMPQANPGGWSYVGQICRASRLTRPLSAPRIPSWRVISTATRSLTAAAGPATIPLWSSS